MSTEGRKKRVHKWDLVRAFLIVMVVWGHFANEYARPADGDMFMKAAAIWIYSFHMPLFICLSGLFAKPYGEKAPFPLEKPVYYCLLGYLLKCLIYIIKYFFNRKPVFMWLSDTGLPWYMFAMAAFVILTWLLRKADWRIVLAGAVLLSCGAGYFSGIGIFLNLSRIIVFFPFYYLGYLLEADKVQSFFENRKVQAVSVFLLVCSLLIAGLCTRQVYKAIRLFTGRNPYAGINWGPPLEWMGLCRFFSYMISLAVSAGILSLIPDRPCPRAETVGRRTLQVYFWHRLVLYFLMYGGVNRWIEGHFPGCWRMVWLGIATALPVILAHPLFGYPLQMVRWWEEAGISLAGRPGRGKEAGGRGNRGPSDVVIFIMGTGFAAGLLFFVYYTGRR